MAMMNPEVVRDRQSYASCGLTLDVAQRISGPDQRISGVADQTYPAQDLCTAGHGAGHGTGYPVRTRGYPVLQTGYPVMICI